MKFFFDNKIFCYIFICIFCFGCTVPKPAPVENRAVKPQEKSPEYYSNSDRRRVEKNGFYTVQKGDTLFGIALAFGQNWRDIAFWNSLSNPNLISVGQKLRVKPSVMTRKEALSIPLENVEKDSAVEEVVVGKSSSSNDIGPIASIDQEKPFLNEETDLLDSNIISNLSWIWPANGQVIEEFAESNSKGISIAGVSGEAIYASGDGKVVYSGNGLRGYGNLVILKHKEDFISAYAHNKKILVNEGDVVEQGQKIAEMGMTESDIPKLLFELRKGGKPIDPIGFLPKR
tara:strand:- start:822 stop:1682 length:861 start_codon:yes stop_codon:yes gene_type:complete